MTADQDFHSALTQESRIQAMLQIEAALAKALAKADVISQDHAEAIFDACTSEPFDTASIISGGSKAGTLVIPLIKEIIARTRTHSEEASRFVHLGATSQDILDTATVLQLRQVLLQISDRLSRIEAGFTQVAKQHVHTPMLGRTLLQAGPPISFGLKAAGWAAAVRRSRFRLEERSQQALCLQFGGAVGNLSSLGSQGMEVAQHLAEELELPLPEAPWHSYRDCLAALASAAGILIGSLGKIARDISLLAQREVAELHEPTEAGKGGSSAMPHKRNPIDCMTVLAAANRAPGLVSSLLSVIPQEHERGLGGWQSEWPNLRDLFTAALEASTAMANIAEGLEVDVAKMLANLEATNEVVFSERLSAALLPSLGRVEAQKLVAALIKQSTEHNRKLSQAAAEDSTVQSVVDPDSLAAVFNLEQALGSSSEFIKRLLKQET